MSSNTRTNARQMRMRELALQEAEKEMRQQNVSSLSHPVRPIAVKGVPTNPVRSVPPRISETDALKRVDYPHELDEDEWDLLDPNILSNFLSPSNSSVTMPPTTGEGRERFLSSHFSQQPPFDASTTGETDSGADGESLSQHTLSPLTDTPLSDVKSPILPQTQRFFVQAGSVDSSRGGRPCPIRIVSTSGTSGNLRVSSSSYQPWSGAGVGVGVGSPTASISLTPLRLTPPAPGTVTLVSQDVSISPQQPPTVLYLRHSNNVPASGAISQLFPQQIFVQQQQPQQQQQANHQNGPQLNSMPVTIKASTSCPTHISYEDGLLHLPAGGNLVLRLPTTSTAHLDENQQQPPIQSRGALSLSSSSSVPKKSPLLTPAHTAQQQHLRIEERSSEVNLSSGGGLPTREKQKRVSHNRVERRRRDLINRNIEVLGDLVPGNYFRENESKKHKGNILTATVAYLSQLRQQEMADKVLRQESMSAAEAITALLDRAKSLRSLLQQEGIVQTGDDDAISQCERSLSQWMTLQQEQQQQQQQHRLSSDSLDSLPLFRRTSESQQQMRQEMSASSSRLKLEPLSVASQQSEVHMEVDDDMEDG